ncbi:large ribosomal subunit protein mL38-like isoform X2 [Gordionus sp. m RMFG-2023]
MPPKHILQIHPLELPTLKEKLKAQEIHDELYDKVNIGLKYTTKISKDVAIKRSNMVRSIKKDPKMEEQARLRTYRMNVKEAEDEWHKTIGPEQLLNLANHYNIMSDLYDLAYFYPVKPLKITHNLQDTCVPVYRGNILTSLEAADAPDVTFASEPDEYYTLILTSLDAHMTISKAEYLHWHICNIPGNDISAGETLCHYLRPFYPHGTGYHRMVFVLYAQDGRMDMTTEKLSNPCYSLKDRTFSTLEFYRRFQDHITPVGLNFYQSIWDDSLPIFFRETLKMRVPYFQYDMEANIRKSRQKTYPSGKRFDNYLDYHQDPYIKNKDVLTLKLRQFDVSPFEKRSSPVYPNFALLDSKMTNWQKDDCVKQRLGQGRYKNMNDID